MSDLPDSLAADEKAYFESRGEAEIKDAPQSEPPAEQTTPEVIDPDTTDIDAIEEVKAEEGGEDKPKVHKVVPLPALTKERQKTKDLSRQLEESNRRAAILEDRWNQVLSTQQQPQAEEKPSRPDDPFALINYVADKIENQEKTAEEQRKAAQEEQQRQQALRELNEAENAFRAQNTDYDDAVKFAAESRDGELRVLFPLSTPEQRMQTIQAEWQQIIAYSRQTRHNPAELIYKFAKARGFVKAEPPKDPKADLEALGKAVEGATSLSDTSGAAPETVSAQSIADMSPEAFAAWYAKPGNVDKFRRVAGGR